MKHSNIQCTNNYVNSNKLYTLRCTKSIDL